MFTRCKIVKIT